jgi:hypothetical protein
MAVVNRADENTTPLTIESSLKVELKPSFVGSKSSSPSTLHPYFLKSYQTSQRTAKLLHPRSSKSRKEATEIRDEVISELLDAPAKDPVPEYAPEADKLTTGRPPAPMISARDTVSLESHQPARSREVRPPRLQTHPRLRPYKAPAMNYPLLFYSISLNTICFTLIFVILYLIMQVPGTTRVNTLEIYRDLRLEMAPFPQWFNTGCIIAAAICVIRILIFRIRYGLGLTIGVCVGLNTLLSRSIEGFVGNGIVSGFCISTVILICVIVVGKMKLEPEDTTLLSMVAGLSVIPITGHSMHFLAGLFIGMAVGLCTQIVLLLYIKLFK